MLPLGATATITRSTWRHHHRPSEPPLKTAPTGIACFLASHVSSEDRANDLERVLRSISAQLGTPPPLSVSWSCEPALAPRVRSILATAAAGVSLRQLEQPHKTSQFEHYRALAALHAPAPPVWVMFTDDDDIWSERRTAIYERQCHTSR